MPQIVKEMRHSLILAEGVFLQFFEVLDDFGAVNVLVLSWLKVSLRVDNLYVFKSILRIKVADVDPHTIDPSLEPEQDRLLVDGLSDLGFFEIQVRLANSEQVEIVLLGRLVPFPRGTSEDSLPVSGRVAFTVDVARRSPYVVLPVRVVL